jgi:protein-S-isoprenylcysteine O-methyltransferase Ste14
MDTARYVVALIMLVAFPPGLVIWLLIHPFIGFWRRLGPGASYAVLVPVMAGLGGVAYGFQASLLAVEYGTRWPLVGLAVPLLLVSLVIRRHHRRHLDLGTLAGIPELTPGGRSGTLLTEGIYARVRHPRYLEALVGGLALALFANYLAGYVLVTGLVLTAAVVVRLEERELIARFGESYLEYSARVPRFWPRPRGAPEQARRRVSGSPGL